MYKYDEEKFSTKSGETDGQQERSVKGKNTKLLLLMFFGVVFVLVAVYVFMGSLFSFLSRSIE